jgi:hypothetical protein
LVKEEDWVKEGRWEDMGSVGKDVKGWDRRRSEIPGSTYSHFPG